MKERRASEFTNLCDKGHVLLVALLLIFLLGVAGMTSLYLAGQDGLGVSAMKEDNVSQQLADGAADAVISWFHDPSVTPTSVAGFFVKRQGDPSSGPSFFDVAGARSLSGPLTVPTSSLMQRTRRTIRCSTILPAASPVPWEDLGEFLS